MNRSEDHPPFKQLPTTWHTREDRANRWTMVKNGFLLVHVVLLHHLAIFSPVTCLHNSNGPVQSPTSISAQQPIRSLTILRKLKYEQIVSFKCPYFVGMVVYCCSIQGGIYRISGPSHTLTLTLYCRVNNGNPGPVHPNRADIQRVKLSGLN